MKGFVLLAILVVVHTHGSYASLVVQGPAQPVLVLQDPALEVQGPVLMIQGPAQPVLVVLGPALEVQGPAQSVLEVQGPDKPVLEGDTVTLECLISDPELNTSQVHFERWSKYMQQWYRLVPERNPYRYRCFSGFDYDLEVSRAEDRLLLFISNVQRFYQGPYRCVSDHNNNNSNNNNNNNNATAASEPLTLTVHYMRELTVWRSGFSRYFGAALQDLRVPLGGDVELDCSAAASQEPAYYWRKEGEEWIFPSSKLVLRKVRLEDGGSFTCVASHPIVTSLRKTLTISITVLPENAPWYQSTDGRLVLMTSAVGVAILVLVLSVSVFLCRRNKQSKTSKGPIDDHSQTKPIYRTSLESLPSSIGDPASDQQPLV